MIGALKAALPLSDSTDQMLRLQSLISNQSDDIKSIRNSTSAQVQVLKSIAQGFQITSSQIMFTTLTVFLLGVTFFGLLVAKRRGLNLKLLIPGIVITAISFLLLLFFHSTSQAINGALFVFGLAGALLPMTLTNTTIAFTPKEYTGIGSATTNMMRIIGGAIGPVLTTVILASATVSITVDNVEKSYQAQSHLTFYLDWEQ